MHMPCLSPVPRFSASLSTLHSSLHSPRKLSSSSSATPTMSINLLTATAADIQTKLTDNSITSSQLVKLYLAQIARHNDYLKAVIATTPVNLLEKAAAELDGERASGSVRGPLHGIPILVKDSIATGPGLGLPTTCGSLALVGSMPRKNAALIDRLIAAGAIILGKANLSEWAWYRSDLADSGWSAVGGQTQSAYVRGGFLKDDTGGGHSNPGGSSSGSAVAVSAGFCPIAVGVETTGSIIMPSDRAALYAMRPTVKLVSQEGLVPVTYEGDSAGPMAKSALDLANLLDVLVDPSMPTVPKGGYKTAVTGSWDGIKIGLLEPEKWLFPVDIVKYEKQAMDQMFQDWEAAYKKLESVVKVAKRVTVISLEEATIGGKMDIWNAYGHTYKSNLEKYLAGLENSKIYTLKDLIDFNEAHAEQELPPSAPNQSGLIRALNCNMTDDQYHEILSFARDKCGNNGIDKTLRENGIDILIGPGDGQLFNLAGGAGYPVATLPLGYLDFNGRPFGFQMVARRYQESLLIQAQSAWEATFPKRQPPPLLDA